MIELQAIFDVKFNNIQCADHTLSRPSLSITTSDRDNSESPGKSTMGDRNDGSWMSAGVKPSPFSTYLSLLSYLWHYSGYTLLSLTVTIHSLHWIIGRTF